MARRKSYKFTNRKHSEKAIMASILGVISLISLSAVIFLSYRHGGETHAGYGISGLLATIFSIVGLILGITTAREMNNFRFFPLAGIILNGLSLGMIAFLLYVGV